MESCDTNVPVYYFNRDCQEHEPALQYFVPRFENDDFAICELVLVELYVLLRSPKVFKQPLAAAEALATVQALRTNPHWRLIDYPGTLMEAVWQRLDRGTRHLIFDIRLALTLEHHGVTSFATRNTSDFSNFEFEAFNPIDNPPERPTMNPRKS